MKFMMMKGVGGVDQMVQGEGPVPEPDAGKVQVKVAATGVSFADIMMRSGRYPIKMGPGFVPGLEVAGTISAVGADVPETWLGKRVYGHLYGGGYAEYAVLPLEQCVELPGSVGFEDAIATGVNALAAAFAVQRTGVKTGDRVLVRGASGGIGVMAVQLFALAGAHVVAATSSTKAADVFRDLGAAEVVGRDCAGVSEGGFDIIVDSVGGPDMAGFIHHLRPFGRIMLNGVAAGRPGDDMLEAMLQNFQKSISISTYSLNPEDMNERREALVRIMSLIADDKLSPVIHCATSLWNVGEAHSIMEEGRSFGKIVLTV